MSDASNEQSIPLGTMNFSGGKAVVVLLLVVAFFGYRLMSMGKEVVDKGLRKNLEVQLVCDYLPGDTAALRAAVDSGDKAAIAKVSASVTTTKAKIESVKASYPLFSTSSNKEVIVKVIYSLSDSSGDRGSKTKYYKYKHSSLTKHWSYQYESSKLGYHLNFM